MKIPYLNVETCENVLVICNAWFFLFFTCYRPQILSSVWALICAKWEVCRRRSVSFNGVVSNNSCQSLGAASLN